MVQPGDLGVRNDPVVGLCLPNIRAPVPPEWLSCTPGDVVFDLDCDHQPRHTTAVPVVEPEGRIDELDESQARGEFSRS
jgi:hypothetical protein